MVAMSGGVDSAVAAALLASRGLEVAGVFMLIAPEDGPQQAEPAQRLARRLGLPLVVVDLRAEFKQRVLDYFVSSYRRGRTPNPCLVCNRTIKFGLLRETAQGLGFPVLATGHYARVEPGQDGLIRLLGGLDAGKDQSYFLAGLTQGHLAGLELPLGGMSKAKVRQRAEEMGLSGLHGQESQDVCFLKGREMADFFADSPCPPGEFVTLSGEGRGWHRGLCHYTVGQRRGLGIPDVTPFYVVALDAARNQVLIGKESDLWREALAVAEMNWVSGQEPFLPQEFMVKIRYRHRPAVAVVSRGAGGLQIRFAEPQRAVTPGQFAVLYREDEVVGGGEII